MGGTYPFDRVFFFLQGADKRKYGALNGFLVRRTGCRQVCTKVSKYCLEQSRGLQIRNLLSVSSELAVSSSTLMQTPVHIIIIS